MTPPRVIVAGAGLSGLACAFDLVRGGADVTVLEAGERSGGVVGTVEREGFRFELGPNTIPASSEQFRRLCGDLGLAGRLIASSPAADERYLFLDGRLRLLPTSPASFLLSPVLSLRARLFVCTEILRRWKPPPDGAPEPDFATFISERLGPEAARVLAGAFVRGVYAADLSDLGAKSAFPRMWKACEEHGGLVRGLRASMRKAMPELPGPQVPRTALLSFPEGLREIVDALARSLGNRLRTRTPVERLERSASGWRASTAAGDAIEAPHLVLAVPAPVAARLLAPVAPREFPLDHLRRVRHASVTLVHLGLAGVELPRLPRGFGYLVPPRAAAPPTAGRNRAVRGEPRALGTIFTSNLFPGRAPEGCVAVSSFYQSGDVDGLDERAQSALACEDLSRALGEPRVPRTRVADIRRWRDVIPRYAPGHLERMDEIERTAREHLPGLHLAGSYVAGVSVEQVVARGRAVAAEILR